MIAAHKNENGEIQTAKEHLVGTARLAKTFATGFGAGNYAEILGLCHDIGKYSKAFQRRILEGNPMQVDHSTAGAKELKAMGMLPAAFCAAGHHAGLPDGGGSKDISGLPTLMSRIKKETPDYQRFREEIPLKAVPLPELPLQNGFDMSFFIRMLFSSLVDADFLDTERFMNASEIKRGEYDSLETLLKALERHIEPWWQPKNALNAKRYEILRSCLECAKEKKGLFTLTVPTGGGKTVSSLAFALRHAVLNQMSRVIYVIPYTSIIEQTAQIFRAILGEENVLEHHSNVDFDAAENEDAISQKRKLAAQNWDAPVIVTTNVQFFESLFANRTSRCRKLHNLANSVVIFDEAQMLPLPFLAPCLRAVEVLCRDYGATAVLCTATQPALEKFFSEKLPVREIGPDIEALYTFFQRTTLKHIGKQSKQEIAEQMTGQEQALTIVSTRAQAADLYAALPEEGRFHLSTLMTPVDRRRALTVIRERLKKGLTCRVAATSLVEAGVDVDFPMVFRSEAGLDSLIQAAGRCNREGKRPPEESFVSVYQPEDAPPLMIKKNIEMLHETMECFADLTSPEAIKDYFDRLHKFKGEGGLDQKKIIEAFEKGWDGCLLPFAQVAKDFRLIDTDTRSVLIPCIEDKDGVIDRLRGGELSRGLLRKAGAFQVNIYPKHYMALYEAGDIEPIADNLAVLVNETLYDPNTGLSLKADEGKALFV